MAEYLVSRRRILAAVMLVAATAAWGSTFLVMKNAVASTPVPEFLAWRFALASLLLVGLRPKALIRLSRRGWAQGAALGVVLAAGYLVQTYGLQHTSAAISGFLTGLQVVFTPLLAWLLLGHRPGRRTWVAITVATSGLAELTLRGVSIGAGEVLTVACALLFALQIIGVSRWVSPEETYGLATVQLMVVALLCMAVQLPSGVQVPASSGEWQALVITAVAATAFAFAVQSWAQAYISATAASLVFALEPVFAALFAWGAGERLGSSVVLGGALVVASMLVLATGSSTPAPAPAGTPAASVREEPSAGGFAGGLDHQHGHVVGENPAAVGQHLSLDRSGYPGGVVRSTLDAAHETFGAEHRLRRAGLGDTVGVEDQAVAIP